MCVCEHVCHSICSSSDNVVEQSCLPSSFYLSIPEYELMFPGLPGKHIYLQSHLTILSSKCIQAGASAHPVARLLESILLFYRRTLEKENFVSCSILTSKFKSGNSNRVCSTTFSIAPRTGPGPSTGQAK